MSYSFIESKPKTPFPSAVRKVWLFGSIVLIVLMAGVVFAHIKKAQLNKTLQEQRQEQASTEGQTRELRKQMQGYVLVSAMNEQMMTANQLYADQVGDLMGLIPDDTVLHQFERLKNALIFSGVSQDVSAFKTLMIRALSGQYALSLSEVNELDDSNHFYFYFVTSGAHNEP